MLLKNPTFKNLCYILLAVFCFIFAKNWEPGIGVSTATYGVFAKNILQTGNWFHFSLGPGLYDPFIDHPYLVLWLDAIAFKLFGISAQTIRLVASLLGICTIGFIYLSVKNLTSELHSAWTCLCLFTVTIFLNFMAGGWLDIPMIAFIIAAFYFATIPSQKSFCFLLSGLCLSAALLTKGIGALGTIPVGIYVLIICARKPAALVLFLIGCVTPLALFTGAHYMHEGFWFWPAYLARQFSQNGTNATPGNPEPFWYFAYLWEMAPLLVLLFPFGIVRLWKNHRGLALMVIAQLALHLVVYSTSSRHYRQYTLPVYPWLAITAGYFLATTVKKWTLTGITKSLAIIGLVFFVAVDILPIRVHAGSENPFRAFMSSMPTLKDNGQIYFPSTIETQDIWEINGSYISWFLDRTPIRVNPDQFKAELAKAPTALAIVTPQEMEALGLTAQAGFNSHQICFWNEEFILLAAPEICPQKSQSYRPVENRKQIFTR